MWNISFRRLPLIYFISSILPQCFLYPVVEGLDISTLWAIEGPDGKICLDDDNICNDSSSVTRLDYTVHKNVKLAKYEIFKSDCEEQFEFGKEPIEGKTNDLSLSSPSEGTDTVTASIEMRVKKEFLVSSWWRRIINTEKHQQTIQFCVRMGLWLPPDVGNMMVNFRETNVDIVFNRTESTEGEEYVATSIKLEPKELKLISVNLGFGGGIEEEEEGAKETAGILDEEKKDEL